MNLEEIDSIQDLLDTDDVGQKRYIMYCIFDQVLEKFYAEKADELPEIQDRVKMLNGLDGYIYKLAQEFLTSSSTMEKERKLERIVDRAKKL